MKKFAKTELPENDVFLMVSRMLKTKGTLEFFKAAEIVKAQYPEVRFLYVGKTENTNAYIKMDDIKKYIDNKIVEYLGETDDVPSIISRSSVFVLPSYYREGIPRTLLEALAMGRPIITTDNVGCREVIDKEKNGFLISVRNEKELAQKMIYMIENREKLIKMGEESYRYCVDKFDVKKINKSMLEIINI